MDSAKELREQVKLLLTSAFPFATILFENAGADPFLIGVGVYGVKKRLVKSVESRILELDSKLCADSDFVLVPMVRDEETTEKYYPEFVAPWRWADTLVPVDWREQDTQRPIDSRFLGPDGTRGWTGSERLYEAANQELALAA